MELSLSVPDQLSLTSSYQMDSALQNTLKRVSREIQVRRSCPKDNKQPLPPVYEMVGNSIAYQLLLQSHPGISVELINRTYPVLKNLQISVQWLYDDYLELFKTALKKKATPKCLHPADLPTIKFLVDLCVHASSIPLDEKNAYITPTPSLWMHLLAIFSSSLQNQACLVEYRSSSKVVGCMNLTSMADDIKLQCYGWEVLSNILQSPPIDITKPAVHIQAVTLLLSHIRRQCEQFYHDDNLIQSILKFLSKLTSITRACSLATPQTADSTGTPLSYSKDDSLEIISLLEETSIRKILLDLPEHLQDDLAIKTLLQSVLLSLAPTILHTPPDESLMLTTTRPNRRLPKPPPKPKRSKIRSQYFHSDKETGNILRIPRKLPDIPSKRLSTSQSTQNFNKALDCVSVSYDSEYSLPAGIISHSNASIKRKQQTSVSSVENDKSRETQRNSSGTESIEQNGEQMMSKPRSLTYVKRNKKQSGGKASTSTTTLCGAGPEQLAHYNRVSLNKTRGSYIKAVTSSQIKYEKTEHGPPKTSDIFSQVQSQSDVVLQALSDRKEMISNIVQLWKSDKALQAASNLVMSCFFNGEADLPLFADCLDCFCSYPSQWSLGICIVLLPYVRRTTSCELQTRYLHAVNTMVELVMKRFSVIIIGIKTNKHLSRVHMEQRQACYHELHLLFTTVMKLEKTQTTETEIEKLVELLAPFNEPL